MTDITIKEQRGWLRCTRCPLHKTRNNVVLGRGNTDAKMMFIGEGPGVEEDREGEPFVGKSGHLLDNVFRVFDINRSDVFLDNVVACWPFIMDNERKVSRKPSSEELLACRQRVQQSIYTVDPIVIVALGDSALQSLTGTSGILKSAGEVFETAVPGWYTEVTYPVYAMYHPAYILRQTPPNPNEKRVNKKHPLHKFYSNFTDMLETVRMLSEAYHGVDFL